MGESAYATSRCGARRSLMVLQSTRVPMSHQRRRRRLGGELTRAWLNFLCIDVVDLDAPLLEHQTFFLGSLITARSLFDACIACAAQLAVSFLCIHYYSSLAITAPPSPYSNRTQKQHLHSQSRQQRWQRQPLWRFQAWEAKQVCFFQSFKFKKQFQEGWESSSRCTSHGCR